MTADVGAAARLAPPGGALLPADREVSAATADRIRSAVPDNTRRAYHRWWHGHQHCRGHRLAAQRPPGLDCPVCDQIRIDTGWEPWCHAEGRTPLPATRETFAEWVTSLVERDLAPASIAQAMAAIRKAHRLAGYGKDSPPNELAQLVLRDHRQQRADQGRGRPRQAAAIDLPGLRAMVATCDPDTLIGRRDLILLLLTTAFFGRRSEAAALAVADVERDPKGLLVHIRRSKTDQDAKGSTRAVLHGSFPDTDPVAAFERWMEILDGAGGAEGRLLRSTQHNRLGEAITGAGINERVKAMAAAAGLAYADRVTAHSLRAAGATMAYMNGAPPSAIAELGGWAPNSPQVLGYIRLIEQWRNHPLRGVL